MKKLVIFLLSVFFIYLIADPIPPLGDGTEADPYEICCIENLLWVSTYDIFWLPGLYYVQINDINASETSSWNSGSGFPPIGATGSYFQANFDGLGHTIDSLYINYHPDNAIGFFARTDSASICNLNLTNLYVRGYDYTGGLAGICDNSNIDGVSIQGNVVGHTRVGMLTGYSYHSFIDNCNITGDLDGWHILGGVTGSLNGIIFNCTSEVTIDGVDTAGGIAGSIGQSVLYNCVAVSEIDVNDSAGGISYSFRNSEIYDCYAEFSIEAASNYSGLAVDRDYSSVINSYYNYETSLFNDEHAVTYGALTDALFNDWLANEMSLEIDQYLELYSDDIYEINDEEDLTCLLPFGEDEHNFILMADLDLAEMPNFYIPSFKGSFNGNGHIISGLNITHSQLDGTGFFGYIDCSDVSDLQLSNINVSGHYNSGGLAGESRDSNFTNCSVTGSMQGYYFIGGIAGLANYTNFTYCSFSGEVTGSGNVGGIAGRCEYSTLELDYVTGQINADDYTGGLIGYGSGNELTESFVQVEISGESNTGGLAGGFHQGVLENCYVLGSVIGQSVTGGLIGRSFDSEISFCYARAVMEPALYTGGLIGYNTSDICLCIWDNELSGCDDFIGYHLSGNIIYLCAADSLMMQDISLYIDLNWDFTNESINGTEDFWSIDSEINNGFPYLTDLLPPVSQNDAVMPVSSWLSDLKASPNPFNPETCISFRLTEKVPELKITVYNLKGQKIWQKITDNASPGYHYIHWNGQNSHANPVASGIYLYQISAENINEAGKLVLLK